MDTSRFRTLWTCAALALAAGLVAPPARADPQRDHDKARTALQAGAISPLHTVLAKVHQTYPGEVLEVELEQEDGRWIYELKLLQPGGMLTRLEVDARTGDILKSRQRPTPPVVHKP